MKNNIIKKIVALTLVGALEIGFTACGSDTGSSSTVSVNETEELSASAATEEKSSEAETTVEENDMGCKQRIFKSKFDTASKSNLEIVYYACIFRRT